MARLVILYYFDFGWVGFDIRSGKIGLVVGCVMMLGQE